MWLEPRAVAVRRVRLRLARWPAELDGLRLALVSDLHAGAPHVDERRVERVVERVMRERPDLVALLGDYVDPTVAFGGFLEPEKVAARLARLRAPLGVVAVLGNHDWSTDGPRVAAALRDAGISVLENEAVPAGGGRLWVVGLADATKRRPDMDAAFAAVPAGAPALVLSHDPDVFPHVPARAALTVAGHTHGGQVDLPVARRFVIPSRFGARYRRGHVVEGGRHLFITAGVGTSRFPIRLGVPSEVVVLRLSPA